MISVCQTCQTA